MMKKASSSITVDGSFYSVHQDFLPYCSNSFQRKPRSTRDFFTVYGGEEYEEVTCGRGEEANKYIFCPSEYSPFTPFLRRIIKQRTP